MKQVDFGEVSAPWWDDRPVFILGGGPSLAGRDLSGLRRRGWVLGVNRAAAVVPCDATFSLDTLFITEFHDVLAEWAAVHEVYLAVLRGHGPDLVPGAVYLSRQDRQGLSADRGMIFNGLNSGYGALNLAVLKGAREIHLLGFDMRPTAVDKPTHWHGGYPWPSRRKEVHFDRWAQLFDQAAAALPEGVRVINANRRSAIRAFPFGDYQAIGL